MLKKIQWSTKILILINRSWEKFSEIYEDKQRKIKALDLKLTLLIFLNLVAGTFYSNFKDSRIASESVGVMGHLRIDEISIGYIFILNVV